MSNVFNIIANPHCDDGEMVMVKGGKVLDAGMILKERDTLRAQLAVAVEALERMAHGKWSSYTNGTEMVETDEWYSSHPKEISKDALAKIAAMNKEAE